MTTAPAAVRETGVAELLGLLDTLESTILEGAKIPFSKRVMVDEEKVLALLDKIRLVVQAGGSLVRQAIATRPENGGPPVLESSPVPQKGSMPPDVQASEILEQAYELAREIRSGADRYADDVLANLEATSARILRAIRAGRDRLKNPNGAH